MQGFFQTPDPNPNHTVGWETLPVTRLRETPDSVRNHGFGKNADAIKNRFFLINLFFTYPDMNYPGPLGRWST